MKKRSESQTAISVSLSKSLLADIDDRAQELGLSRSQFLAFAAKINIEQGGPLVIPSTSQTTDQLHLRRRFLDIFIQALKDYERAHSAEEIEFPEHLADTDLVKRFYEEVAEIARHKWNESARNGEDIGHERAIREWSRKHHDLWLAAQDQSTD